MDNINPVGTPATDIPAQQPVQETQQNVQKAPDISTSEGRMNYFLNKNAQTNTGTPAVQKQQENITPAQMFKIKHNGKEVELSHDDLIANAQKGYDYEYKVQQFAPLKNIQGLLKSSGLTESDISLLAKAKSGDATAFSVLAKKHGVNLYDLDDVSDDVISKYDSPETRQSSEQNAQAKEMLSALEQTSPESYQKLISVRQALPEVVGNTIFDNPAALNAMYMDVQSGVFEKVYAKMQTKITGMDAFQQQYVMNDANAFGQLYAATFGEMSKEFQNMESQKTNPVTVAKASIQQDGMTRQPARPLGQGDLLNMTSEQRQALLLASKQRR